ncbi:hypothetical protein MTO96_047987 [Rhipicephalus appendiculatus]
MQKILWVVLTMMVVSASEDEDCEEDHGKYFAFYNISLIGDPVTYTCLQCFAPPCDGDGLQSMRPLTETLEMCCRSCSQSMEGGAACNLERTEPAVVCQEGDICSVTKKLWYSIN